MVLSEAWLPWIKLGNVWVVKVRLSRVAWIIDDDLMAGILWVITSPHSFFDLQTSISGFVFAIDVWKGFEFFKPCLMWVDFI